MFIMYNCLLVHMRIICEYSLKKSFLCKYYNNNLTFQSLSTCQEGNDGRTKEEFTP